jgi:hypothetical protein
MQNVTVNEYGHLVVCDKVLPWGPEDVVGLKDEDYKITRDRYPVGSPEWQFFQILRDNKGKL